MKQCLCIAFGCLVIAAGALFLSSCSFASDRLSQNAPGILTDGTKGEVEKEIEKEATIEEQANALTPEDPRRQRIMTLTWQIQYQRERLKFLEMKYLAACYKDEEYRNALTAIGNLNKQIRQLILL